MSYRYYANSRHPNSLWMMDDDAPFLDHTGLGGVAQMSQGSPTRSNPLVSGATYSSVFSNANRAEFITPFFQRGREEDSFLLEAWVLPIAGTTQGPQKILSHAGAYDGLTINGSVVTFQVNYETTGVSRVSYDLGELRAAHVAAVHTSDKNSLYVDSVLVGEVQVTAEQKLDLFANLGANLYAGETASTQRVALNAVAVYASARTEVLEPNFIAGRNVVPVEDVSSSIRGKRLELNAKDGDLYLDYDWVDDEDFLGGLLENVNVFSGQVVPVVVDGLSTNGMFTCGVSIDNGGTAYGVVAEWSASGVIVESSIGGDTWLPITSGNMIPQMTQNMDTVGKDVELRFTFQAGRVPEEVFIDSIRITAYTSPQVNTPEPRDVSMTYPAFIHGEHSPNEYRTRNGIELDGGTLTIGLDESESPVDLRTLEFWVKPGPSGVYAVDLGGNFFQNSEPFSGIPNGEWALFHITNAEPVTTPIVFSGDMTVSNIVVYEDALTTAQMKYVYECYTGRPVMRVEETGNVTVTEPANPVSLYAHDWSVD